MATAMVPRVTLVLLLVSLTGGLAYIARGPPLHPVPQADDQSDFAFDDIWDPAFRPKRFDGRWFGDTLVYKSKDGHVMGRDMANNGSETTLITAAELTSHAVDLFYPSPDLTEILLVTHWKQVWRHSYTAVYHVYDVATKNMSALAGGERLQYCRWAPAGGALAYVHGNNIFYLATSGASALQVTTDGKARDVYNGIPDWLYEEDVLSTSVAHYWSPNARYIVFAKFNDTLVPKQKFKMYGDKSDVYGQIEEISYPKAGDITPDDQPGHNPQTTLHLVDTTNPSNIVHIAPPASLRDQDHYYTCVGWLNDGHVLITWTNRVQNESVVQACNVTGTDVMCYDHLDYKVSNGWIDAPWPRPLPVTSDGLHYVITHPRPEGESGSWRQVTKLAVDGGLVSDVTFLTTGQQEVLSISAYDEHNNDVYFLSTGGDPTKRHLYRVNVDNSTEGPTCVSCDVGPGCQYASASFSTSASWYVLTCSGPEVPTYSVRSTRDDTVIMMEDNQALADKVSTKRMPTREFMDFTVGGYKTQAEIFKPPGFDANKKYPLLLFVYAGPGSQRVMQSYPLGSSQLARHVSVPLFITPVPFRYAGPGSQRVMQSYPLGSSQRNWLNYLRSSHDVVVASVDGRGAAARGDNFRFEMYRRLGTVEVDDQIAFAKHLRDNLGYIDTSKETAIFGWSYGGQTSSHVLAEAGDVIKCAIAVAPVTTKTFYDTAYTERYMGFATKADNEGGYNTTDVLHKAAMYKDRKYLIAHGTADDNVHFMHAAHMINELVKEEIQFTQLMYVDENHSIGTRAHSRHLFRALTNFLVDDCWDLNAPTAAPPTVTTPVAAAGTNAASLSLLASLLGAIFVFRRFV